MSVADEELAGREGSSALVAALIFSLLLHAAGLLWAVDAGLGLPSAPNAAPTQPELGNPDSERSASMAWISHEAFREVAGPQSEAPQPALQKDANPVETAPPRLEPTPPVPAPGRPRPSAPRAAPQAAKPPSLAYAPAGERSPARSLAAAPTGRGPSFERGFGAAPAESSQKRAEENEPRPGEASEEAPAESQKKPERVEVHKTRKAEADAQSERADRRKRERDAPEGAAPDRPAEPTAVPRADGEADPASKAPAPVRPGGVTTGRGLELKTVRPEFGIVARMSSAPRNPVVSMTFDKNGEVTNARILRSSGYPNVDGPILSSLYKWRAEGERLEKTDGPVRIKLTIVLMGE